MSDGFAGDTKASRWLLREIETRCVGVCATKVPGWLETQHLTLLTLVWSAGVLGVAYLARSDYRWLWGVSVLVVLQYATDVLDGAVGRMRGTGLVRWGYYMDHLVDFVFMASVFFGWALVLPGPSRMLVFAVFGLCGVFTTDSHLTFSVTNEFHTAHFGVGATELRIVFVLVNSLAAVFGDPLLELLLPIAVVGLLLALSLIVYRTQRRVWAMDMRAKQAGAAPQPATKPMRRSRSAQRGSSRRRTAIGSMPSSTSHRSRAA